MNSRWGTALIDSHEEWQVSERRYLSKASMALLSPAQPAPIRPRHTEEDTAPAAIQRHRRDQLSHPRGRPTSTTPTDAIHR